MQPGAVETAAETAPAPLPAAPGGCYRVQVLVVGRQKRWRDEVAAQARNAGFQATTCDRGVDAMTVLALGLPVDVLVVDASLQGGASLQEGLCCAELTVEARALRPSLRIVLASDPFDAGADTVSGLVPDALTVRRDRFHNGLVARTVREALAHRAAPREHRV